MTTEAGLRPTSASDESFLVRAFVAARPELTVLPAAVIDLQIRSRQQQYRSAFPAAAEFVIVVDAEPVGCCWIARTDDEIRVLDIAVLPEHRRRGIGRAVLGTLIRQADERRVPFRLSVWHANVAAIRLYEHLGLRPGGERQGYLDMERAPVRVAVP